MSNPLTETALQQLTRKVNFIESGGYTQRMHCIPTIHPQSVAAHSFGVAWWCWLLTAGNPSANLLLAALAHDLPEHEVGDIPAPTKRLLDRQAIQDMEDAVMFDGGMPIFVLNQTEERLLKLSDSLELVQHCLRERTLGNKTAKLESMYQNALVYAKDNINFSIETEAAAYNLMQIKWRNL